MAAAENKKLVQEIFGRIKSAMAAASSSIGPKSVTMTVIAHYSWLQTFSGKTSGIAEIAAGGPG